MPLRPRYVAVAAAALVFALVVVGLWRFHVRVEALRELHATGPAWSFPSRVYSADLPLVEGAWIPRPYLVRELEARAYTPGGSAAPGRYAETADGFVIGLRGFADVPDPDGTGGPERVRLDFDGARLVRVERLGALDGQHPPDLRHPPRLEPVLVAVLLDSARVRRTWVPLARIPRVVQDAVVASEDRRFRRHGGLDLRSNARALFRNVRAGGVREGGSTLTQQLARGLFVGRRRTYARKVQEALIALALEGLLSKDEILEMYLNSVYWGQEGGDGIGGIAEAARAYFGEPVESLTLPQAALLAGIIPAPNALSPFRSPILARRARDRVLRDMATTGVITPERAAGAMRAPLLARHERPPTDRFPSFTGLVRDELSWRLGGGSAEHDGLWVMTTMDPVWQADAESTLVAAVASVEAWHGRAARPLQGAFIALDAGSGAVRAVVGGRGIVSGDFNRATHAQRQPGSAIKPIVYAAALDPLRGTPHLTPASTVPDERHAFDTPEGPWIPRNDEADYHASVTLAKALAKSLNVATANLVAAIGPEAVARYAERFGLGRFKPVASIGLGTNEVSLYALASAYTTFANGGIRPPPSVLRAVVTVRGRPAAVTHLHAARVLPVETAALMTGLLEDVVIFGVAYPLRKNFGFDRPVAGKTGTTNDYRDAWFMGFTPDVTAGVWVGYDQPAPLGAPAAQIAIPVWARVVRRLLTGFPARAFASDDALELAWIDPFSGGLARADCPHPMRVPFLPGTRPTRYCTLDHTADWQRIHDQALADSLRRLGEVSPDSVPFPPEPPPQP